MVDVVTKGTGGGVNFGNMAIAGKTGTTSSYKDVWFAGFTPYYTATTWTGYDNNADLPSSDRNLSKSMWKTVMKALHENLEYKSFEVPNGITTATVCSASGKLPDPELCSEHLKTEYFAEGTIPHETCNVHYKGMVCAATGLPADYMCPFKVPGILTLPLPEPPALWQGSNSNGNQTSCPHNAEFFADPNYHEMLEEQRQMLQEMGYDFSLEGY